MPIVYAARSAALTAWASDVGLGKHVYRLGVAPDREAAKADVAAGWAGETDWKIVASRDVEEADEAALIARLSAREKPIDPDYYPRLQGATGMFRVSLTNVQNGMLVQQAMQSPDQPLQAPKAKAKDVAEHLIRNALG